VLHPSVLPGAMIFGIGFAGSVALIAPEPMPWFLAVPLLVIGAAVTAFGIGRSKHEVR
jgi:hypothetical protein